MFFRYLPALLIGVEVIVAFLSSYFVYIGLTTKTQRIQSRLRFKERVNKNQKNLVQLAEESKAEKMLKGAGYPLRLNGLRYHILYTAIVLFLIINYVVLPVLIGTQISVIALVFIVLVYLFLMPNFPYSLFKFFIKRALDYKLAKKNSEIFVLYDLIIIEIQAMTQNRINTYNMLKNLRGYFSVIDKELTTLLSNWNTHAGPKAALDQFGKDLGTKEIKSLVAVLKTLDEIDRDTALTSLKGMSKMFVRSQIENYRRRRKVFTDLASIPIKASHFINILNVLVVVIVMVMIIMKSSQ